MWSDDAQCGPGVIVNSIGTYCEAVFANGAIAVSVCGGGVCVCVEGVCVCVWGRGGTIYSGSILYSIDSKVSLSCVCYTVYVLYSERIYAARGVLYYYLSAIKSLLLLV